MFYGRHNVERSAAEQTVCHSRVHVLLSLNSLEQIDAIFVPDVNVWEVVDYKQSVRTCCLRERQHLDNPNRAHAAGAPEEEDA